MNALSETYDGFRIRLADRPQRGRSGFLRRLADRLAAQDYEAERRFPDEEEIRLAVHALGRGFDCM